MILKHQIATINLYDAEIPGEKPRHPERSEGSPESCSVLCLGDPSLRSG